MTFKLSLVQCKYEINYSFSFFFPTVTSFAFDTLFFMFYQLFRFFIEFTSFSYFWFSVTILIHTDRCCEATRPENGGQSLQLNAAGFSFIVVITFWCMFWCCGKGKQYVFFLSLIILYLQENKVLYKKWYFSIALLKFPFLVKILNRVMQS